MGKLNVINNLPHETISVREGTGSAFLLVRSILPNQQYVVDVDSKATFRELLLILEKFPERLQAKFNSDDCLEYAEIRITGYNASELLFEKVPKSKHDVAGMITDASLRNARQSVLGACQSVLGFIGIGGKRRPSAPRPAGVPQTAVAHQLAVASQANQATHPEEATQTDGAEDRATAPVI